MAVKATIVVHFGEDVDSSAFGMAELDDAMNVDAQGNIVTSFAPGDDVYFLAQHDNSLRIDRVAATHGAIEGQGKDMRERTDQLTFAEINKPQQLTAIPSGAKTITWYSGWPAQCSLSFAGRSVVANGYVPCRCDVTYEANMHCYRLLTPNVELGEDETYPVDIYIYMENA